ncbi:MAG: sodium/solute symporter [Alphaproteobacteria bacterium]|nr:sodium/solute symporter [Alphaproteobacteria bacterium]
MEKFGVLNWGIVVAYLIGNLLLGYIMSRRIHSAQDYYLGDKSAPWWAIGISVAATYVSALSFLGGPAWAYGDGMAALAIHINYALVVFACIVFFIPFFYNSGVASIYEYLERRFGLATRTIMAALFTLTVTIGAASILTATAIVVTFATGLDPITAIILMTSIVLIYTLLGGMNAVIWTDVLQGVILIIGALTILWFLLLEIAPISSAIDFLSENGKLNPINTDLDFSIAPTIWAGVFAMTLYHITVYGANQMMVQRALAAKNIGDAKKSYLFMGFGAFFIYFMFFFIGALLYVHYQGKVFEQPNAIILLFAESLAIPGLLGILGAAILSASMSTTSSAFNSLATITVTDFYKIFVYQSGSDNHYLLMSRLFTIVWAICVIPMAILFIQSKGSILETLSSAGSYLVGAKLAIFGMGFFSKHVSERGLLIGVAAGFIGVFICAKGIPFTPITAPSIAWPWFVVIGGGVNIIVSWVASILLDGFQVTWHPQSVPGQLQKYARTGETGLEGGWYHVAGKVEPIVWLLPIFFIFSLLFLIWFGTLG